MTSGGKRLHRRDRCDWCPISGLAVQRVHTRCPIPIPIPVLTRFGAGAGNCAACSKRRVLPIAVFATASTARPLPGTCERGTHWTALAALTLFKSRPRISYSHKPQAAENLACLRLTDKGLLRWYSTCCQTPIGNTSANWKISFVGQSISIDAIFLIAACARNTWARGCFH